MRRNYQRPFLPTRLVLGISHRHLMEILQAFQKTQRTMMFEMTVAPPNACPPVP